MSTHIDGYAVEKKLGEGASGEVFLVRLPGRQRFAALKLLRGGAGSGEVIRFKREFTAIIRCQHPNIVSVYGTGEFQGVPYYLMEYLKGLNLLEHLRQGLRPMEVLPDDRMKELVEISRQALNALSYLHGRKMIHRDLKPANIVITENRTVKLLDFGLVWNPGSGSDREGGGTAGYLSPEQIRGTRIDPRSDLYALGICLYESLCGLHPFGSQGDWKTMIERQLSGEVTPPSRLHPEIPETWDHFFARLLAVDTLSRFQTAGQALGDLHRIQPAPARKNLEMDETGWGLLETEWLDPYGDLKTASGWLDSGEAAILAVIGSPRSGRSRFLEELERQVPEGCRTFRLDFNIESNLVPVAGSLNRFFHESLSGSKKYSGTEHKFIRDYLEAAEGIDRISPQKRREIFIGSFSDFPGYFSSQNRAVLFFDNVDRCSGLAGEIVHILAGHATRWCRIVFSCRPDTPMPSGKIKRIDLKSHRSQDCSQYLKLVLGVDKIPRKTAARMSALTDGRFGLIRDILNAWIRNGTLRYREGSWQIGPPLLPEYSEFLAISDPDILRAPKSIIPSLPLVERLDREVLRTLAAYKRGCPFTFLAGIFAAREELLLEVLDRLIRTGWIVEKMDEKEMFFHFTNPELGTAIYEGISPFHRAYLHHRIAEVSAKKSDYPEDRDEFLAEHYSRSETPFQAVEFLKTAGLNAQRRFDHQNAIRYFDLIQEISERAKQHRIQPLPCPPGMMIGFDHYSPGDMMTAYYNTRDMMARSFDELWIWSAGEKGQVYSTRGEYGLAFEEFHKMADRARELSFEREESKALRFIGQVLFYQKQFDESAKYFNQSLAIREKLGDDRGIADCLNALGAISQRTGKLVMAGEYFQRALTVIRILKDNRGYAYMLNNLGNIQFMKKEYPEALKNFEKSYRMLKELDDSVGMSYSSFNAGEAYRAQGDFPRALERLQTALDLRLKMDDLRGAAVCYRNLGETKLQMGDAKSGAQILQKAAELYREMGCEDEAGECERSVRGESI
ncbi:tetratricopeptide repeat protein [bacterium]|nr:tetratricopeptide repeat protein [candidate division CSSED10-310 bacterium]